MPTFLFLVDKAWSGQAGARGSVSGAVSARHHEVGCDERAGAGVGVVHPPPVHRRWIVTYELQRCHVGVSGVGGEVISPPPMMSSSRRPSGRGARGRSPPEPALAPPPTLPPPRPLSPVSSQWRDPSPVNDRRPPHRHDDDGGTDGIGNNGKGNTISRGEASRIVDFVGEERMVC